MEGATWGLIIIGNAYPTVPFLSNFPFSSPLKCEKIQIKLRQDWECIQDDVRGG